MFDGVFETLENHAVFEFELFGHTIEVSSSIVVMWILMAIIILLAVIATRRLSVDKPGKAQCLAEMLVEFIKNMCEEAMGHYWRVFLPYIGTLFLFLVFCNITAVINFLPFIHMYPPTKDINVTATFALITIVVVVTSTFRFKGIKGWAKGLVHPIPVMLPFNLLEYASKPLSLCLRLFGNVIAAFIIMEIILMLAPFVAAPFSAYFDLFDGILQAYIFVYLTTIYIGEAVEEH